MHRRRQHVERADCARKRSTARLRWPRRDRRAHLRHSKSRKLRDTRESAAHQARHRIVKRGCQHGQTPEMWAAFQRLPMMPSSAFTREPNRIQGIADTVSTRRPSVNTMAVFGYNSCSSHDLRFRARILSVATRVPIILSGGAGTRLWPLSRESAPKPSHAASGRRDAARQDGHCGRSLCPVSLG